MNGINLIPGSILEQRRRRRRIQIWSGATAGYAALLVGSYGAFATAAADAAGTRQQIANLAAQVERERAGLADLRVQAAEAMREADAARLMAGHPDWSVLLALLAGPLGPDMTLESCELARIEPPRADPAAAPAPGAPAPRPPAPGPDSFRVSLSGLARTQSQVTTYALDLERLGGEDGKLFKTVTLVEAKGRRISTTDVVAFRIECVLAAATPPTGGTR